jgi:hypothetical protein
MPDFNMPAGRIIAISGFNNEKGLNATNKLDEPYPLGKSNVEGGMGESGWVAPWPADPNATFVREGTYEGDGALHLQARSENYHRTLSEPQTGQFVVEMAFRCPSGTGGVFYIQQDRSMNGPCFNIDKGKFHVTDGDGHDGGPIIDVGECTPDKWHLVTITIDVPRRKYKFQIDDKLTDREFGFRRPATDLRTINFLLEGESEVYVDAIRVYKK